MPSVVNVHLQASSSSVLRCSIAVGRIPIRPIHRHLSTLDHIILPVVQVREIGECHLTTIYPGHIGASGLAPIPYVSHRPRDTRTRPPMASLPEQQGRNLPVSFLQRGQPAGPHAIYQAIIGVDFIKARVIGIDGCISENCLHLRDDPRMNIGKL
jgi:hypothetical protein